MSHRFVRWVPVVLVVAGTLTMGPLSVAQAQVTSSGLRHQAGPGLYDTANPSLAGGGIAFPVSADRPPANTGRGSIWRTDAFEPRDPSSSPGGDHATRDRNLRAVGYSILLPGLAQYKMGHKTRGLAYMVAEATFWTSFAILRGKGELREDSYLQMAESFAGVRDVGGRDDDYLKRLGSWLSSDDYDDVVIRREARALYGDDLDAREEYFQANRTPEDSRWEWDSITAVLDYRDKRSDSQRAFKRSRDMIGLAVANRLVAIVDAVLLSRSVTESETGLRLEFTPVRRQGETVGRLGLTRRFR